MPIYEYKCPECEITKTKLVRKLDAPPPKCEACAEERKVEVRGQLPPEGRRLVRRRLLLMGQFPPVAVR